MIRLLAILLLALAFGGCSSGSDPEQPAPPTSPAAPPATPPAAPQPIGFEAFFRQAFANPGPEPLEFNAIVFADNGDTANFNDLLVPDPNG